MRSIRLRALALFVLLASIAAVACAGHGGGDSGGPTPSPSPTTSPTTPLPTPTPGWIAVMALDSGDITMEQANGSPTWPLPRPTGAGFSGRPVALPAATRFAFAPRVNGTNGSLIASNLDGTGMQTLLTGGSMFEIRPLDAAHLLVTQRNAGTGDDLVRVNVDGSGSLPLAASGSNESFTMITGGRIVYSRASADGSSSQVRSVSLAGTGDAALTPVSPFGSAMVVGTSSNGRVISNWFEQGVGAHVTATNPDGTTVVDLAASTPNASAFLISGNRVVYRAGSASTWSFYAINSDGSTYTQLTNAGAGINDECYPDFCEVTPSGRLVFDRDNGTGIELMSVPIAGGSEVDLGPASATGFLTVRGVSGNSLIVQPATYGDLILVDTGTGTQTPLLTMAGNKTLDAVTHGQLLAHVDARLYAIPLTGGTPQQVTPGVSASDYFFASRIVSDTAFVVTVTSTGTTLYAVNLASNDTATPVVTEAGATSMYIHDFLPDGRIVYTTAFTDLFVIRADGTGKVVMPVETGNNFGWGFFPGY